MEAFRNLNDSIIVELLKNLPKGIVTKFLMRHKQWTKNTEVFARPMSTEDKKKVLILCYLYSLNISILT